MSTLSITSMETMAFDREAATGGFAVVEKLVALVRRWLQSLTATDSGSHWAVTALAHD